VTEKATVGVESRPKPFADPHLPLSQQQQIKSMNAWLQILMIPQQCETMQRLK